MMTRNPLKQSLEHAWESLSEGWRDLRERTAGALTRFSRPPARSGKDEDGDAANEEAFVSGSWGLLATDVYDADDKLVVRVEVPGLRKEDLSIEVRGDTLLVQGHKRFEREKSDGRYRLMQCSYGSFQRVIELPAAVKADKASAACRDGVLRIELPKLEPRQTRRITVRSA